MSSREHPKHDQAEALGVLAVRHRVMPGDIPPIAVPHHHGGIGGQLMLERLIILIEVQQHQPGGIEQTEIMIRQADLFSAVAGQVTDILPGGEVVRRPRDLPTDVVGVGLGHDPDALDPLPLVGGSLHLAQPRPGRPLRVGLTSEEPPQRCLFPGQVVPVPDLQLEDRVLEAVVQLGELLWGERRHSDPPFSPPSARLPLDARAGLAS